MCQWRENWSGWWITEMKALRTSRKRFESKHLTISQLSNRWNEVVTFTDMNPILSKTAVTQNPLSNDTSQPIAKYCTICPKYMNIIYLFIEHDLPELPEYYLFVYRACANCFHAKPNFHSTAQNLLRAWCVFIWCKSILELTIINPFISIHSPLEVGRDCCLKWPFQSAEKCTKIERYSKMELKSHQTSTISIFNTHILF